MSDMGNPLKRVKPAYIWIGGGALSIGAYVWYTRRQAAATATQVPADPNAATDGTDPNAYDSAGYGAYGDYSAASGVSPSLYGYVDPASGQFIGSTGPTNIITAPSTNGEWAQQATAYLTGLGYNPVAVAAALGKYLLGQGLSNSELGVVQAAIGAEGNPPKPVPPPHVAPPTGVTKPKVPSGGLKAPVISIGHLSVNAGQIVWAAVPGAVKYTLYFHLAPVSTTTHTFVNVPRHTSGWTVVAVNGAARSPKSNALSVK